MTQQLELFVGAHVPLTRCLAALEDGDLNAAQQALAGATPSPGAAVDRGRLAAIEASAPRIGDAGSIPAAEVHQVFEAALTADDLPSTAGAIPVESWFRLYARYIAAALDAGTVTRFRGWYAVDFLLGAADFDAALRSAGHLIRTSPEGPGWLEAARAVGVAGDRQRAKSWLTQACLDCHDPLDPAPPRIDPSGIAALDPPRDALPRFPTNVEDLWTEVEELGLPGPASCWVPSVGIIDGVLDPSLFDQDAHPPGRCEAPRAFFRALLAALDARSRAPLPLIQPGDAEKVHRDVMKRLAPGLLARYLARLEGVRVRSRAHR
ncbi:MAG: hypothetical protein ACREMB_19195 [Candidatus Rokuibacteriota bacterium]